MMRWCDDATRSKNHIKQGFLNTFLMNTQLSVWTVTINSSAVLENNSGWKCSVWYSLVDRNAKDCPLVSFGLRIWKWNVTAEKNQDGIIFQFSPSLWSHSITDWKWNLWKWHELPSFPCDYLLIITSYHGEEKLNLDRKSLELDVSKGGKGNDSS